MRGSSERGRVPAEPTRGGRMPGERPGRDRAAGRPGHPSGRNATAWETPAYRVLALDCEITAYAPDDEPLF